MLRSQCVKMLALLAMVLSIYGCQQPKQAGPTVSVFTLYGMGLGVDLQDVYKKWGQPAKIENRAGKKYYLFSVQNLPKGPEPFNAFVATNQDGKVVEISGAPLTFSGERLDCNAKPQDVKNALAKIGASDATEMKVEKDTYGLSYNLSDGKLQALFEPTGRETIYILSAK